MLFRYCVSQSYRLCAISYNANGHQEFHLYIWNLHALSGFQLSAVTNATRNDLMSLRNDGIEHSSAMAYSLNETY